MKTCYLYSLIAPPPEDFVDNRSFPPLLTIPVKLKDGREWEIAILGTPGEIRAVRISMPETEGPTINPEDYRPGIDDALLDEPNLAARAAETLVAVGARAGNE
jgi:hypothetical protein